MLYLLSPYLEQSWGPFRLFRSHALLLAAGTLLAAFAVLLLLPRLWNFAPHDHGKSILGVCSLERSKPVILEVYSDHCDALMDELQELMC